MPRITPVAGPHSPMVLRLLNWGARRAIGNEMTPLKTIAHNPRFLLPYLGTIRFVRARTELDSTIRALATQRVAEINDCAWCIDFGRAEGRRGGIDAGKLLAVADFATDPRFTPAERAALAFTEAATAVGARVPEPVFAEARRHFSERAIVELTVAVAIENFYNRINAPLAIGAQGFCAVPAMRRLDSQAA